MKKQPFTEHITRREWLRQNSITLDSLSAGLNFFSSCSNQTGEGLTIGVAFDTLQTEYWVDSIETMEKELKKRGYNMLQAIADNDVNRQFEQVKNFLAQGVDGIIIAPKDAQSVVTMIQEANQAGVPIVLYNRPPAESSARSVTVVADNFEITKATVQYMAQQAQASGLKYKGMILIGDLGDMNAIQRRTGISRSSGSIRISSRTALRFLLSGIMKRLWHESLTLSRRIPISTLFSPPPIFTCLHWCRHSDAGKYHKIGEEGHVLMGGFDGDATAYQMLVDGYLDADGVQDMFFESEQAVQAIVDLREEKEVPAIITDRLRHPSG